MASRAIHVTIASLTLKGFQFAFSRFNDVRDKVKVIYSDNGIPFQATAKSPPKLLYITELRNAFRKKKSYGNLSLRMLRQKVAPDSRWRNSLSSFRKGF